MIRDHSDFPIDLNTRAMYLLDRTRKPFYQYSTVQRVVANHETSVGYSDKESFKLL